MKKLLAIGAVAIALAITGCTITFGPPRVITESVAAPQDGAVNVIASTGSIEIIGGDVATVDVTATVRETVWSPFLGPRTPAEAVVLDIDTTNGVTVRHSPAETRGISVEYDLRVPTGTDVGSVVSDTGSITVTNVAGDPVMQTSTGSITANGVAGTVTASSSTGSLTIRNVASVGPLSSGTGSITAEVRGLAPVEGLVSVSTSTGSVRLYIDPDIPLNFVAETGTGSISVHEDLQLVISYLGDGELGGAMNGGGTLLDVHTGTGSISLYPLD